MLCRLSGSAVVVSGVRGGTEGAAARVLEEIRLLHSNRICLPSARRALRQQSRPTR